jgi:hypothetical protein
MLLAADLSNGEWIAVAAIVLPLIFAFIGWLTYIAVKIGQILQRLDGFWEIQKTHTAALESQGGRLNVHDIRLTKLEA